MGVERDGNGGDALVICIPSARVAPRKGVVRGVGRRVVNKKRNV